MTFAKVILSVFLGFGSIAAFAGEIHQPSKFMCSVDADWLDCGSAGAQHDFGCSVTCDKDKTAVCHEGDAYENFDPTHPGGAIFNQCAFYPSTCDCE
jgi:hypothetical protein